jgi:hypothetical protein
LRNPQDDFIVLPTKVDALIDMIDKQYPLTNFPSTTDYATLQRHFGARDVVDFLRALQRERDEEARR